MPAKIAAKRGVMYCRISNIKSSRSRDSFVFSPQPHHHAGEAPDCEILSIGFNCDGISSEAKYDSSCPQTGAATEGLQKQGTVQAFTPTLPFLASPTRYKELIPSCFVATNQCV
jgi:hypothetical protein